MRVRPIDDSRRHRRFPGGRVGIVVAVGLVVVLLVSLRGLAVFYTNELWFASLRLTSVWGRMVETRSALAVAFSGAFFVVTWLSLALADRLAPPLETLGPADEFVRRYRRIVGRRPVLIRTIASAVLALLAGTGASAEWQDWILFTHAVPFSGKDPLFHRNIAFFVFRLPFLSFTVNWAFVALIVVTIVTAVAHYLNGGIRIQGPGQRVAPRVKAHLSLLLALLALVKAAGYFLARYQLDFSNRGYREGAFYTDIHAELPALSLLILVSLVCCVIFLVNMRRQGWALPVIAVSLWAFVAVVVGAIYPAIVQAFVVRPAQLSKEYPYLERNITATRTAMGLSDVRVESFRDAPDPTIKTAADDLSTLQDIRLWDPQVIKTSINELQSLRSYYQFNTIGIDRYNLGGTLTPTIVAVRDLQSDGIPSNSWVNNHLQYTHGYGAALAPANATGPAGNPEFAVQDVPPVSSPGAPVIRQPEVYFGTGLSGYVIADTKQPELNYQSPQTGRSNESHYQGTGGVLADGFLRRAAFAIRFGDLNPLISNLITPHSRIMFVRNITTRVRKVAPFLQYDSSPYPVIVNSRIYYVLDAYTTTDDYPYAQEGDTSSLSSTSGLNTNFNYVRNSVKVVIDAYNGTMKFYVVDPRDPIIRAYEEAFPKLFTPAAKMPVALKAHLRYPTDLFTVQAAMYGRYHITNPAEFYNAGDAWTTAADPTMATSGSAADTTVATDLLGNPVGQAGQARMPPGYQVSRLPGDASLTFNLTEPYVGVSGNGSQQSVTGFLAARCTPGQYGDGQLEVYETPRGSQVDGPTMASTEIQQNATITSALSQLGRHGSHTVLGAMAIVPIGQSLLYVDPVYVESNRDPLPQLKRVIVVSGGHSAMAPTFAGALAKVLGGAVPGLAVPGSSATSGSGGSIAPAVASLIQQADAALAQAQVDLRQGDLSGYQHEVNLAQELLDQAQRLESRASHGASSTTHRKPRAVPVGPTTTTTGAA